MKDRNYPGSPIFHMRIKEGIYDWFRDYAKRQGKSMSAILKEYLSELQRKDLSVQRPAQRKALDSW